MPPVQITLNNFINQLKQPEKLRSIIVPILFVLMLGVVIVPIPPALMDVFISANIALSVLILLTTLYVERPLDFSVMPSLLLGTTLFRLVLNIATTRMILSADAATPDEATAVAGDVIASFAEFVAGGNAVVGIILFVILIIVQFVVITKGATRISEVAARFTLDGMPGKQMAIDADLNAGIISEEEAKTRRENISQEADFYGAMDGSAKFVRGDAIAGIIITVINILGGFAIGMAIKKWSFSDSIEVFTMLTIGDGLVSQVPAFIISIASGLIVTRSSSRNDLGTELTTQLTARKAALGITAGFLVLLAFTGLPKLPMLTLAFAIGAIAYILNRASKRAAQQAGSPAQQQAQQDAAAAEPEPVEAALKVDTLELEVGYGLVKLVDKGQGGDLLDRISMIRRQLAADLGLVMPPVRIRDNMQLQPNDYNIKIRNNTIASGDIHPGHYLAMDGGLATEPLEGIPTTEPAFGLPATWIEAGQKERAESLSYTVVDPSNVLTTHLIEVVKNHGHELLTREETNNLLTQLKETAPKLTEEVLTAEKPLIKPGELQKVLQNLLRERVPIRDMESIVETLGDWSPRTNDLEVLTEYVRNALRRTICNQYAIRQPEQSDDLTQTGRLVSRLYCVSLDPMLEDQIMGYIQRTADGTSMTMPPIIANRITTSIVEEIQNLVQMGHQPVILASPQVRAQIRRLIEPQLPNVAVLGYNEVSKGVQVESLGLIQAVQTTDQQSPAQPTIPQPNPA
ncbi:Flagellar biosynthesis protein FlhA [Poriferisphaera corsica]|uniref:Flagellar biosynthesis protein FlhA n=1 Tax=Poriferisphaera corsica TaxID=2528020 RepID=A0A517YSI2_9BACT|nr:flagellar biosynthesis protein FlhA [Poriferisphaera corsica]QDU33186.1 Flagellar biosynthesis protein FlhA [Poriferisphaera corsica]